MRRRAWLLAALALAGAGCPALQTPEERVEGALARLRAAGLVLEVPGAPPLRVVANRLTATDLSATEPERGMLLAFGRFEATGETGGVAVSYLGAEKVNVSCTGTCEVVGVPLPRLAQVLRSLHDRRRALGARDPHALAALASSRYRDPDGGPDTIPARQLPAAAPAPSAWTIRVDGEEAVVSEQAGAAARKLLLVREADRFLFQTGLP